MSEITITNKTTMQAEGKRNNKNCKPVICIETGEVFTSSADAAEKVGVHFSAMSAVCTGKIKTCKGMHFCYTSAALENLNAVMERLREATALEEDARKWREQEAEKERIRLEEERKQNEIIKLQNKVEKLQADAVTYKDKWHRAMNALNDAQMQLENLLDQTA